MVDGATSSGGVFVRTPKSGDGVGGYQARVHGLVLVELALAFYFVVACLLVIRVGYLSSLPFLSLFAVGYGSVGLQSARAAFGRGRTRRPQLAPAAK